jgi:alpha-L-rhamnosidase
MRPLPGDTAWPDPPRSTRWDPPYPTALFASCYLIRSLDAVASMAGVLGRDEEARKYAGLAGEFRQAVAKEFIRADGTIEADFPQGAYAHALWAGVGSPEGLYQHALRQIERDGRHLTTGIFGTPRLLEELSMRGDHALAWHLVMKPDYPSYGYMIDHGATTMWERFEAIMPELDPPVLAGMNDFCHIDLTTVNGWIMRHVAGIQPDPKHPGFKRFRVMPEMGAGPEWVKASYDSIRGTIVCNWKRADGRGEMDVTVPPNTEADVTLPFAAAQTVTEGGNLLTECAGVSGVESRSGNTTLKLASGHYHFAWPWRQRGKEHEP